ncbi:MAG TPA: hypothetical protein VFO21_05915 [Vicinamibacterales bacterium]|nr:hypothetical protein [Vicinamibacterales bacterium]
MRVIAELEPMQECAVEQWPELPRSPAGRIDKLRIRATFWQNTAAAVASQRTGWR